MLQTKVKEYLSKNVGKTELLKKSLFENTLLKKFFDPAANAEGYELFVTPAGKLILQIYREL